MKPNNKYRNNYCGSLTEENIGETVKLSGWIENIRDHGGVIFVDVRDEKGTIQTVTNDEKLFDGLTRESTICLTGKVRKRNEEDYNARISTGTIEVLVDSLEVLGAAKNVLPFEVMTSTEVNEETRLKYRYLDLRNKKVHDNILFRTKVISYLREKMNSLEFTEIQTPILTASSPEGARDFIVPSRKYHGKFYALPQAPQIFKQLLMVSGFDKYFQVAPCFRDEDARKDRVYGEFYQLDMEMCFAEQEDIYALGEEIFTDVFKKFSDKEVSTKPFVRIPYKESMLKYGTDKPDLRNPLIIIDLTSEFSETTFKPFKNTTVRGIKVDGIADKSNSWFNELVDFASSLGMPGIGYITVNEDMTFKGPIDKFLSDKERENLIKVADLKKGSVLFFIADKYNAAQLAGAIRDELGRKLNLLDENKFEFCIINDFPMFEYDEKLRKYEFCHNPFSLPHESNIEYNKDNMDEILAYQYDFVCNGNEMASGAIRNHDLDSLAKGFEIVGYSREEVENRFKSIFTAFKYGCPPHGGMAPGIDRLIMLIQDEPNLREVQAFPVSTSGQDLMMGSPSTLEPKQLEELGIKIKEE